jgi:ABC-2 type transport system ATP-binding protein
VLALKIDNLVKRYGDLTAVNGISFDVPAGEFFGLLGPNGAGKTTTINSIDWRAARRMVGLSPQEYNFDRYLNIRDILIYQAGYYGMRGKAVAERADDLLERFDLTSKAKQVYTRLSGGMKRRLTIARAMMHQPRLLILDEPTAGVDVELRLELWSFLRQLNVDGTTIILTTHYLEEAEELCARIGIIEAGQLVALETTRKLVGTRSLQDVFLELTRR